MQEPILDIDYTMMRDVPVLFPKSRKEDLSKERTTGELLNFINENNLYYLFEAAIRANNRGFAFAMINGEFVEEDGELFFEAINVNGGKERIKAEEGGFDEILKSKDCHLIMINEGDDYKIIGVNKTDNPKADNLRCILAVAESYIPFAGINTYRKLGREINKNWEAFKQMRTAGQASIRPKK